MIRLPSNQKPYDEFYSRDDAFAHPAEDAPQAEWDEYNAKVRICRETGDWSAIQREGEQPTKFTLRPIPADVFRRILDQSTGEGAKYGELELRFIILRCALVGVSNVVDEQGKPFEIKLAPSEYGKIAAVETLNTLAAVNSVLVDELAASAVMCARGLSPKS